MSNRRKINAEQVKQTWWRDQFEAASGEARSVFLRLQDDMVRGDRFSGSGTTRADFLVDRFTRPRVCPHIGAMHSPQVAYMLLNLSVVTCLDCFMRYERELSASIDDRCDFCGNVPEDNWFHETVIHAGCVVAFGHACRACHAASITSSQVVA